MSWGNRAARTHGRAAFRARRRHFAAPIGHFVAAPWPGGAAPTTVRSFLQEDRMPLTPLIAIHMSAALAALVTGPVALWARRGREQRPRLHRAFGYVWVALMIVTAVSALFILDTRLPNIAGFTPIHLLIPVTLVSLVLAFRALAQRRVTTHRRIMQRLYGASAVAGLFTLLPDRFLGHLVLVEALGLDGATRARLFAMGGQIVSHTPVIVWGLLAALLALGLSQARERRVGFARATVLPLAMVALSLWGTASLFGNGPHLTLVLGSWLAAALAAFVPVVRLPAPAGTRFDAASNSFTLPGSWIPMLLIVGVFVLRYATNVALAIQPALGADTAFATGIAAVSGLFTGAFGGRAARLWQLAQRRHATVAVAAGLA
jgi:uncharacterized membrane protein